MKGSLKNYFRTAVRPKTAFSALLADERSFSRGFILILVPIVGYTLMYVFLTIGRGAPSVFTPWLNIPKESYYAVNRFLLAPSMILCWLAATAFIQVLSRALKGAGTFEQTLTVIAASISISMWGGLVHDLPVSIFAALGVLDARQHEIAMNSPTIFRTLLWVCYAAYFLAFLVLFPLAVRVVHRLSPIRSAVVGWAGFAVFQTIFFVFNR